MAGARLFFVQQHIPSRADTIGVAGDFFHCAGFEHPIVIIIRPTPVLARLRFAPIAIGHKLHQLHIHAHLRQQLGFDAFELVEIEGLQINRIAFLGVAVFFQHCQRGAGNVFAFLVVQPRRFDFGINADAFAAGFFQAAHKLQFFFKGVDFKRPLPQRKTIGIHRHLFAVFGFEIFRHLQRADFGQREIGHIIFAVGARAAGEFLRHIGEAVEKMVVYHHKMIVFGHHQILLEIIRTLAECQGLALQCVFG